MEELGEASPYPPTDVVPILAPSSKLRWLRAFPAIRLCQADGNYASIIERENDIAWKNFAYGLVKRIPRTV
jgi:hypothetical protein